MLMKSLPFFILMTLTTSVAFADLRADSHAPAGVMFEHVHKQGEMMIGYRVEQTVQQGGLLNGSKSLAANDALLTKYAMLPTQHTMTMHMLDLMYAPTNNLTLMLMPMYMTMDMSMTENSFYVPTGSVHHHADGDNTSGLGDTTLAALYRLHKDSQQELIATLAVIAPTGQEDIIGSDGNPVHYGMQLGAGIWQVMPSATYTFKQDALTFGGQLLTRQPLQERNRLDVRVPDLYQGTLWLSYAWLHEFSSSLRVQYSKQDIYEGHYNVGHNHGTPPDIQKNYGGEQTLAGVGFNWVTPAGSLKGLRVGLEYLVPINENVNGVQLETSKQWHLSVSKAVGW